MESLNPFGTGQCLPTSIRHAKEYAKYSLNPFGTGQCLPTLQLQIMCKTS